MYNVDSTCQMTEKSVANYIYSYVVIRTFLPRRNSFTEILKTLKSLNQNFNLTFMLYLKKSKLMHLNWSFRICQLNGCFSFIIVCVEV